MNNKIIPLNVELITRKHCVPLFSNSILHLHSCHISGDFPNDRLLLRVLTGSITAGIQETYPILRVSSGALPHPKLWILVIGHSSLSGYVIFLGTLRKLLGAL